MSPHVGAPGRPQANRIARRISLLKSARERSRSSTDDISSGRRGGLRSGKPGPRGRTCDQLYSEARRIGVAGRTRMNKAELQRAVENHKRY